jgi:hypothetical protein
MAENWNCDGAGPHTAGEVRVYPLGAGGNLILCCNCFARENNYRLTRRTGYWANDKRAELHWPTVDWCTAKRYETD